MNNQLQLDASLHTKLALRYTPAGVPALDLELEHHSVQTEAGHQRQTPLRLRAVAFGGLAEQLQSLDLGQHARFHGFLAQGKNGKGVVFHLQSIHL